MKFRLLMALPLVFVSEQAGAEPSIMPLSMQNKYQVEAGTGLGTGNIDHQSYSFAGKVTSKMGRYENNLKGKFAAVNRSNDDSHNVYSINNKLKYDLTPDDYAFGELEYVNNKVAGIERRASESIGYGRRLVNKDGLNIAAEAAIGGRQSEYKAGLADESSYLGKVGTTIDWEVYDNVNLNNDTYMAFTSDNTQTVSDTSVKTYVYDGMYVKGGFNVENNDKAPAGFKKTDTLSTVNVGYEF